MSAALKGKRSGFVETLAVAVKSAGAGSFFHGFSSPGMFDVEPEKVDDPTAAMPLGSTFASGGTSGVASFVVFGPELCNIFSRSCAVVEVRGSAEFPFWSSPGWPEDEEDVEDAAERSVSADWFSESPLGEVFSGTSISCTPKVWAIA